MLICSIPVVLVIASLVRANSLVQPHQSKYFLFAEILMGLAVIVSAANTFLSIIRPLLFRHRPGYKHESGCPMVGSFFNIGATLVGFGSKRLAIVGLIAMVFDTGGMPWLAYVVMRYPGPFD